MYHRAPRVCNLIHTAPAFRCFSAPGQVETSQYYAMISATTPAPTVRPPSRTAKRSSFYIATGVINSTSIAMLSPGITISTFSGSFTVPVTSVVRK